jgi:demethylmenaquinone methyltransferase/2-methoxy-6-polyprenyl-1,4-benzoquinol methylase
MEEGMEEGPMESPSAGTAARPSRDSEEFATQVRGMFDRIAGVYDTMNSAMTAGLHHQWRDRAVDMARVGPGSNALDICCGTGDLTLALRERIGPDGRVVGTDVSQTRPGS